MKTSSPIPPTIIFVFTLSSVCVVNLTCDWCRYERL